jgi:predicted NAD/FAD-binding protein
VGRTAVVGAGISGLGAARFLAGDGEVVVYEAEPRLGGHARTLDVPGASGPVAVDTGFIVYNEVNYPLLTALFAEIGVPTIPSDMSFGVSIDGFEMCASSLPGLFAQKRNLVSPSHWRMLKDITAFFGEAPAVLDDPADPSLGDLVRRLGLGAHMRDRFLVPMGAAIWSTPPGQILDMPAKTFVRFFRNHNLLTTSGHHTWRTVEGGSRVYVAAMRKLLADGFGVSFRAGAAVIRIEQLPDGGHEVVTADGQRDVFDEVVLACHADASLELIAAPSEAERSVLGAFEFRDNLAILHRDASQMPRARAAWASWVYSSSGADAGGSVSVTYWMNRLQSLPGAPLLITLNPSRPIAASAVLDRHTFRHPVLSREAVCAQGRLPQIQGRRGLWFCGAWTRYGFHEDGILSAASVAKAKGLKLPWRIAA